MTIAANDLDPAITAAIPDGEQPGQPVPSPASLPRIRDLGEEI